MKLLTTKNVLTFIGTFNLIQAIGFLFSTEEVAKGAFPILWQAIQSELVRLCMKRCQEPC